MFTSILLAAVSLGIAFGFGLAIGIVLGFTVATVVSDFWNSE